MGFSRVKKDGNLAKLELALVMFRAEILHTLL